MSSMLVFMKYAADAQPLDLGLGQMFSNFWKLRVHCRRMSASIRLIVVICVGMARDRFMEKTLHIRPATVSDAQDIAYVQVAVWNSAYKGLVPDALIERMTVADRAKGWTTILNSFAETGRGACFVAERDGAVQGFASCGAQRDDDLRADYAGEITAIYVQGDHQRNGVGRALMQSCAQAMTQMDLNGSALWVLSENESARAFYAALGAEFITERVETSADGAVSEVAYGWPARSDLA
jgi:ribosomal protein S18 acetylase RimI-like enzyme